MLAAQFAQLCIRDKAEQPFTLIVNKDTLAKSSTSACINGINIEIVAVELLKNGSKLKHLAYLRLGKSHYYEADFTNKSVKATDIYTGGYKAQYIYKSYQNVPNPSLNEDSLTLAENQELSKAAPRYNINAADIFQRQQEAKEEKAEEETASNAGATPIVSTEVDNTANGFSEQKAPPCDNKLDSDSFRELRNQLRNTKDINAQLQQIKSSIKDKCISCQQLLEFYRIIEEDEIKVSLFKQYYAQIYNPEKRNILYSSLLFENSVDEIRKYGRE